MLLPHVPSSVAVARRRLTADLAAQGHCEAAVDDAVLVVSELLSNALRHARPLPSGQVKVAWTCTGDRVRVAVSDGGAATEPRARRPGLSSLGGRGLDIVEHLSESWGVAHEGPITTVWAEVAAVDSPDRPAPNGVSAMTEIARAAEELAEH
ncbi:ATP-binding protein [Bailinhaonella thermotolerans]|nr:ATP-binding protein [Bailinhaonella thermotolerans]